MKIRFSSFFQSPDANEGTVRNSNYSTERTPVSALLFDGKKTVALPAVKPEDYVRTVSDEFQTNSSFVIRHSSF